MDALIRAVRVVRDGVESPDAYPFSIPAVRAIEELALDKRVTFLVGENGSGKSTLVEAIAVAAGFNAEGGSRNMRFATRSSESELHQHLRLVRGARRPKDGYFLRAESFFNVATEVDNVGTGSHGATSLHEQSHGEAFLALIEHRFGDGGLYILDEPEAALSPQRQLALLAHLHRLIKSGSQFLIATHSPILMAYPEALIYELSARGIEPVAYEDTAHYLITRDFLNHRERYLKRLLE